MCILIITIPFGVQAFKLAGYSLWPFGPAAVKKPSAGAGSVIGSIIWLVLARLVARARAHHHGVLPGDHDHWHPACRREREAGPGALWPFGREIVPASEVAAALGGYREEQTAAIPPPIVLPVDEREGELPPPRP